MHSVKMAVTHTKGDICIVSTAVVVSGIAVTGFKQKKKQQARSTLKKVTDCMSL